MKKFICEYLRIIAFTAVALALVMSSFYFVINYYHQEELDKKMYISASDVNQATYMSKLDEVKSNLRKFAASGSTNSALKRMQSELNACDSVMREAGTLATLPLDSYIGVIDVYNLGSRFQTQVLNVCWALHLSYLTEDKVAPEFKDVAPLVKSSITSLSYQTNFALTEIQNNSSYFYSTNITSSTIRNYLSSDYAIIINSYNSFADILVNLSRMLNEEVEEVNNG